MPTRLLPSQSGTAPVLCAMAGLRAMAGPSHGAAPPPRRHPGDEAARGSPSTGEAACRRCGGSGQLQGKPCPDCGGTGKVVEGIGGG